MPAALSRARTHSLALVALASCTSRIPPPPRTAPAPALDARAPSPALDASPTDASTADAARPALCPVRALPPADLAVGVAHEGAVSVTWSGREWGVAWTEIAPTGEPAVFFARVGANGQSRGAPVRVSERSYRARAPSVVWNGENWNVAFSGGAGRLDEIWMARVDVRGTPMGRPHQVTARDRRDASPSLALGTRDMLGVWSATFFDDRSGVIALRMNRWGAQLGPPVRLVDRRERLTSPAAVWNGEGWGIAWLVSRSEAIAVDMARVDAAGAARGYTARVTLGPLGGTDLAARFGIAWDGARYGVAWDEVREGAPHVFFTTVGRRLDGEGRAVMLSPRALSARAPSLLALAPGVFVGAWEVERGGDRHVQIGAFGPDGEPRGEPVEIQGHDGRAESPTLCAGDGALGVATATARGISFHRVLLGPCG